MAHQSLVDRFNSVEAINEGRIKLVHNEWTKLQETYNQYTDAVRALLFFNDLSSSYPSQLNQHKEVLDKNGSKRDSWSMKLKVRHFLSIYYRSYHVKMCGAAVMATSLCLLPFPSSVNLNTTVDTISLHSIWTT